MVNPTFLPPDVRDKAGDAPEITMEELKAMADPAIYADIKYVEPSDVLFIKPFDHIPLLRDFHFGWLNPDRRRRVGMGHWRWVNGELAKLVRSHGIVQEAIGSSAATDMIVNGDLILGFMPYVMYKKRKEYLQQKNQQMLASVRTQETAGGEVNATHQVVQPDVRMRRTLDGRDVGE